MWRKQENCRVEGITVGFVVRYKEILVPEFHGL